MEGPASSRMSRFREIEGKKSDLLDRLSRWTDDQLYFSPAAAQWSAVQVVDHLVRTESEIQKVVLRGLSNPHRIGLSDRARTLFLNTIFTRCSGRAHSEGRIPPI